MYHFSWGSQMIKGKTSLYFEGGPLDKEVLEEIDTRHVQEVISFPKTTWGRQVDGNIQIMSGGKKDNFWLFTAQDAYKKTLRRKDGLIVYSFFESQTIDRCSALTKAGSQCMKAARLGQETCETHQ
jgi:hypothetical protein